jgi:endonuclease YncB( thermonuclease family)
MRRLRQDGDEEEHLLLDVFDVDQYGRLLADVRGVRVGATENILQRWTLAEQCVLAGWAHTTPLYVLPDRVAQALQTSQEQLNGAWGLETDERPFQGMYTVKHRGWMVFF